ncbi:MAG: sulfite exporter TauE/SafE family protein [Planctomycetes bacterium]|nr:sulfite exporter TauE/SafE family protein [Planctomycetota bacterium]
MSEARAQQESASPVVLTAVWGPLAFLSALCGIGGGLFAVPLLHYVGATPLKRAVATSTVIVFILSVVGTLTEALQARPNFIWPAIAALAVGGWAGAFSGFWVSKRVDTRFIKRAFVFVLLFSAYRVLAVSGGATEELGPDARHLGPLYVVLVALIGFVGGFIAPILGVGGGLFVVPALYLSFPSISILEARACSVAMTILTSGQSAWLHARAGSVDAGPLKWLGPATVVGAALGVVAVHQPGWAAVARVGLGVILLAVAARFAWDELRPSANERRN